MEDDLKKMKKMEDNLKKKVEDSLNYFFQIRKNLNWRRTQKKREDNLKKKWKTTLSTILKNQP